MAPEGASHIPGGNTNDGGTGDRLGAATFSTSAVTDSPFQPGSVSSAGFRSVQFAAPRRTRRSGDGDNDDDNDASSRLLDDDDNAEDEGRDSYDGDSRRDAGDWPPLRRRRRSSVGARLSALTDIGGVNSIRSFTRSFQRAAGFTEVIPQRPSFVFAADQEPILGGPGGEGGPYDPYDGTESVEPGSYRASPPAFLSLLRQHLEAGHSSAIASSSDNTSLNAPPSEPGSPIPGQSSVAITDEPNNGQLGGNSERKSLLDSSGQTRTYRAGSTSSIFAWPPHLAAAAAAASAGASGEGVATSPIVGSYGSFRTHRSGSGSHAGGYGSVIGSPAALSYNAMSGRLGPGSQAASMAQAGVLWRQQQEGGIDAMPDDERPEILVKEVEEDGKIVLTVEGQSTLPQTVFNSINVLIGVGLLSLPMGIKYAGWICGMLILFLAAAVTAYTARLLAKCMDLDPVVITFSDLAFISFGPRARLVTSLLFTVELMAACVALIVLFADSLDLLFPGLLSLVEWKIVCCLIMIPLNFLPMRLLSVTSIIGIVSCFSIAAIVVIDGFTKKTTPGSLIEPAVTYLFPANWLTLPLSFGLLMSPWGGHSVFPNIYRDMRHPYKYARAVKITFSFTPPHQYLLDTVTAVAGLLMFGDDVKDEITANILTTSGYSKALTIFLCIFIAIIPLTKIPLNARPIITTVEILTGMHQQTVPDTQALTGRSMYFRGIVKIAIRIVTTVTFLIISIVFPAFDSIMAFMGSALCSTICVTLPILFHLKLFGHEISKADKLFQCTVLVISIIISIIGTVWSFLPKSLIGVENS
ncbi:solute carrier family 32 (vesicular inhibitory amino acid transporter) [Sporothrix brasiliensis 5110]|uniref:Solute carrier family 32 (Vesicular inhibitory amino acid transporter) n=1 Tax=Sporothrix brasiliensis 5110 TaxID=1398154 RepID=A0A0C2FI23_9PEZI|nr:solute carrier family 32 (vesicular inhibitory amino acid transporter) [Sporothrix brasiliensis 5110]KIH90688.1 solute carrier family 32 (vesicular inhibitory amino acid transporter) [Sporothrix brasiliensis 5110]